MQFCVIKTQWNLDIFTYKNFLKTALEAFFLLETLFEKGTGCNGSSIKRGSESELAVVLQRLAS